MARLVDVEDSRGKCHDVAAVADDGGVLVEDVPELLHHTHGVDGRLVAVEHGLVGRLQGRVLGHHFLHPALPRRSVARGPQLVHDLAHDGTGVPDDANVHVAVLPDLAAVHHDLDQRRVLGKHLVGAVAQPEVDRGADEYDDVGLDECVPAPQGAQVRVVRRQAAASHGVQEDRRVDHLNEVAELVRRLAPPDVRARQHHRPLGLPQRLDHLGDILGVAEGLRLGPVALRIADPVLVGPAVHEVDGDLEVHWPRDPASRVAEGVGHVFGDALDPLDLLGELGDGLHEGGAVEVLEPAAQVVADAGVASDEDHRAGGLEGVGDARHGVGDAWPGRHDGHSRLPGDLRPALCGVGGHLLVPEVDNLDSLVDAALVEVVDVPAVQGEDVLHPLML